MNVENGYMFVENLEYLLANGICCEFMGTVCRFDGRNSTTNRKEINELQHSTFAAKGNMIFLAYQRGDCLLHL